MVCFGKNIRHNFSQFGIYFIKVRNSAYCFATFQSRYSYPPALPPWRSNKIPFSITKSYLLYRAYSLRQYTSVATSGTSSRHNSFWVAVGTAISCTSRRSTFYPLQTKFISIVFGRAAVSHQRSMKSSFLPLIPSDHERNHFIGNSDHFSPQLVGFMDKVLPTLPYPDTPMVFLQLFSWKPASLQWSRPYQNR